MNPLAKSQQKVSQPIQAPSPFPISQPESHSVTRWIILLAIFLVMAIVASIFEYNYRYNKSTQVATINTYQAPPAPIPTTDPVNDWRTYTNTAYSYEIKYPSGWVFSDTSDQSSVQFKKSATTNDDSAVEIHIGGSHTAVQTKTFQDYIKNNAASEIQGLDSITTMDPIMTSSDITGFKTVWKLSAGEPSPEKVLTITYFKLPNGKGTQNVQVALNDQAENAVYTQMLKTFRFTDTVQQINTSPTGTATGVACTQEAKQCPDGSYVSRTGPNCAFAACPQ